VESCEQCRGPYSLPYAGPFCACSNLSSVADLARGLEGLCWVLVVLPLLLWSSPCSVCCAPCWCPKDLPAVDHHCPTLQPASTLSCLCNRGLHCGSLCAGAPSNHTASRNEGHCDGERCTAAHAFVQQAFCQAPALLACRPLSSPSPPARMPLNERLMGVTHIVQGR